MLLIAYGVLTVSLLAIGVLLSDVLDTTVGRVVTRQPTLVDAYVELVGTSANGQD